MSLPSADLTGPGAAFEIAESVVQGRPMRVFARATGTLGALFQTMGTHGDADFIVEGERRLSYAQGRDLAAALSAKLARDHAVKPGDRVAIAMRNSTEWMLGFIAVSTLGAVPALVNSRGTGAEMRYCIEDVGASLVLADARRARALRDAGYAGPIVDAESAEFREALIAGSGAPLPAPTGDTDDPACILFTSGTTGRPKGAVLSHRAILSALMIGQHAGAEFFARMLASGGGTFATEQPQPATLLMFPLFHVSGCQSVFLSTLSRGGKIVLLPRWDAGEALRLIEAERITSFAGPPTALWDMLRDPGLGQRDLSALTSIASGGQALPPNLSRSLQQAFPAAVFGGGYGMTETAGAIALSMGDEFTSRPASTGRVHTLAEVRIVDEAGRDLPPGEAGEICVRGPMVMSGYWGKPAESGKALDAEGWLHTGDVGSLDPEGHVTIVDRKTDMVISGGENIYCAEVERVLTDHPAVLEAAAFGVPDERLGERLVAAVVPQPGHALEPSSLRDHVGRHLAAYKVPSAVVVAAEPLPRNASGKVDKQAVRARWLALPA